MGKGTGLGLSTVLAIVKSHGGFVNVAEHDRIGSLLQGAPSGLENGGFDVAEGLDLLRGRRIRFEQHEF
jgi:signal transduction histidine kinase